MKPYGRVRNTYPCERETAPQSKHRKLRNRKAERRQMNKSARAKAKRELNS